jgi:hypothetical protein
MQALAYLSDYDTDLWFRDCSFFCNIFLHDVVILKKFADVGASIGASFDGRKKAQAVAEDYYIRTIKNNKKKYK